MNRKQLLSRKCVCVRNEYPDDPTFEPSLVGELCFTDTGEFRKIHSDIHLLLREKQLSQRVGPHVLREYVDSMLRDRSEDPLTKDLSDDELMDLIQDRRLTDATDLYQFTHKLSEHIDDFKKANETAKARSKAYKERLEKSRKDFLDSIGVK